MEKNRKQLDQPPKAIFRNIPIANGFIKNKIFTWTWGTVTVISSFSPTTSSAGLEVSTEAGLKSSKITVNRASFTNK